jgi:hypothetical protein
MADRPLQRIHAPRAIRTSMCSIRAQLRASTSSPQPPALSSLRESAVGRPKVLWLWLAAWAVDIPYTADPMRMLNKL